MDLHPRMSAPNTTKRSPQLYRLGEKLKLLHNCAQKGIADALKQGLCVQLQRFSTITPLKNTELQDQFDPGVGSTNKKAVDRYLLIYIVGGQRVAAFLG